MSIEGLTPEQIAARAHALVREATQKYLGAPPDRAVVETELRRTMTEKALGWGAHVDLSFRWTDAQVTMVPHNLFTGLLLMVIVPTEEAAKYIECEEAKIGTIRYRFYDGEFTFQPDLPAEQITVSFDFGEDFDG